MKTKTNKTTSTASPKTNKVVAPEKRRALLESYFTNAIVLAALLDSAQKEFRI